MAQRKLTAGGAALAAALFAVPVGTAFGTWEAAPDHGSDAAFNRVIGEMEGRDTGSMWFDYYVEVVNQEIALRDSTEAFGAAGPSGPLTGFDGYIGNFLAPDTGSQWFNEYVDALNRYLREREH